MTSQWPGGIELSVVVPAYNEAETIEQALRRLVEHLDRQPNCSEVIVVSDGCTDGTPDLVEKLELPQVRVVHYAPNRGKGNAQRAGVDASHGKLVAFIDADLDIHPKSLLGLLDRLATTGADAVVASKLHADSEVTYPFFRRLQSSVFRTLVRLLFSLDVADSQTGLKVFRSEVLSTCLPHVDSSGFAFDLELLVRANDAGYRVIEGPVRLDYQFSTTTGAGAVVRMLRDVSRIALRRRESGRLRPVDATSAATLTSD